MIFERVYVSSDNFLIPLSSAIMNFASCEVGCEMSRGITQCQTRNFGKRSFGFECVRVVWLGSNGLDFLGRVDPRQSTDHRVTNQSEGPIGRSDRPPTDRAKRASERASERARLVSARVTFATTTTITSATLRLPRLEPRRTSS